MNSDKQSKSASDGKEDSGTRWPWWGQLLLAVAAMATASGLLIGLPVLSAEIAGNGDVGGLTVWGPMFAVLIGITAMTITGIFVFMSFRIDRGARLEARNEAQEEIRKLSGTISKTIKEIEECADKTKARIEEAGDEVEQNSENVIRKTEEDLKKETDAIKSRAERRLKENETKIVDDMRKKVEKRVAETNIEQMVEDANRRGATEKRGWLRWFRRPDRS